jgi:hypothetical protein
MASSDITYCLPQGEKTCGNKACPRHRDRVDLSPDSMFSFADFTVECPEWEPEEVFGMSSESPDDFISSEAEEITE